MSDRNHPRGGSASIETAQATPKIEVARTRKKIRAASVRNMEIPPKVSGTVWAMSQNDFIGGMNLFGSSNCDFTRVNLPHHRCRIVAVVQKVFKGVRLPREIRGRLD